MARSFVFFWFHHPSWKAAALHIISDRPVKSTVSDTYYSQSLVSPWRDFFLLAYGLNNKTPLCSMRAMASEANQDIWPSNGLVGPPFVTCHLDTGRWSIVDKAHKSDMLIYSWNEMFQLPGKVSDLCHHIALARRHLKRKGGIANEPAFWLLQPVARETKIGLPTGRRHIIYAQFIFGTKCSSCSGKNFDLNNHIALAKRHIKRKRGIACDKLRVKRNRLATDGDRLSKAHIKW